MGWRPFIGFLLITVSVLGGCAKVEFAPPPQAMRAQFGSVRTVALPSEPIVTPDSPVKGAGSGAMAGAGQGFAGSVVGGMQAGAQSGDPLGFIVGTALGVVIAPVAAVVGGVVGASKAHPTEEVEAAHRNFGQVLAQVKPDVELAERLIESIKRRTDVPVADFTLVRPLGYETWVDEGIDTALELSFRHFQLHVDGSIDPDVTLIMGTQAQLFRASDGALLYRRAWDYRGTDYSYFQMAADDGELLRAEIRRAYDAMADKMVYDLFIATKPEVYSAGAMDAGAVWTVEVWPEYPVDTVGATADTQAAYAEPIAEEGKAISAHQISRAIKECVASQDQSKPWIGDWSARSGKAILRLNVNERAVEGVLEFSGRIYTIRGHVNSHGEISAMVVGSPVDGADLEGRFPLLKLDSEGYRRRSLKSINNTAFDLCA